MLLCIIGVRSRGFVGFTQPFDQTYDAKKDSEERIDVQDKKKYKLKHLVTKEMLYQIFDIM